MKAQATSPARLTKQEKALIKFQRYLTAKYPLTSAMSHAIGIYVVTYLIELK